MQAVVAAVAHVAERDAVEVEAELALAEAADGDAGRPFVIAERVGRLDIDAGELLDRLDRARAGRQLDDILCGDFLDPARLALAEHDNLAALRADCIGIGCGRLGHCGCRNESAGGEK